MGPKGRVIWRLWPLWATLWVPRTLRFPAQMALSPIPRPGWCRSTPEVRWHRRYALPCGRGVARGSSLGGGVGWSELVCAG